MRLYVHYSMHRSTSRSVVLVVEGALGLLWLGNCTTAALSTNSATENSARFVGISGVEGEGWGVGCKRGGERRADW